MSYVLILKPAETQGWPAVIGGYPTREEAEAAGKEATMAHLTQEQFEDEGYGLRGPHEQRVKWNQWLHRPWVTYTVIPGAAAV